MIEKPEIDKIVTEAKLDFNKRKFLKSARGFKSAAQAYLSSGNAIKSAEMTNNSSVAYLKGGEPGLALNILNGIELIFQQNGEKHQIAITLGNLGAAFEGLGKIEEAIKHYRLSAEVFSEVGDDDLYTYTVQAISSLQLRKGHPLDALVTMREGLKKIHNQNLLQRFLKFFLDIPIKIFPGKLGLDN
jgi:tetratricopeptide (TPR) repeat protein